MFRLFRALFFAAMTALAASGSTGTGLYYGTGRSSTDAGGPLSVMTYNIKGLPWPVATGREEALDRIADRLAHMRHKGQQPHIVLLQEAFTPQAAQIAARAGYAHVAIGPDASLLSRVAPGPADSAYMADARRDRGERMGKPLGSGLIILSDYRISVVNRMAFPDFACAGFDCLANKGVLIAHLTVPGIAGPVSIVNTHLNARKAAGVPVSRSQRAFARQAEMMAQFIVDHVPAGQAMIIGGDLNIGADRQRAVALFASFRQAGLPFVTPGLSGARRALVQSLCPDGGVRRDLAHSSQRAKDWMFARGTDGAPMAVAAAHVPFGTEPEGVPLSDHFGYVIDYRPGPVTRLATAKHSGSAL